MSIFLSVLKIILIVLVSIIAFILLILLLIVLPFFTYKFNVKKNDDFSAFFSVNYPMSIVKAILSYDNEGIFFTLKLFNIKVYRKTVEELIDMFLKEEDVPEENSENNIADDYVSNKGSVNDKTDSVQTVEKESDLKNDEGISDNKQIDSNRNRTNNSLHKDNKKKQSFEDKFKHIVSLILKKWYNIKEFFENLYANIQKAEKYIKYYIKVINYKSMEPALKVVKKTLISLYRMLVPRKVYGLIEYGSTDPQICAKMYGYYCLIYPKFGKHLEYIPHFDEDICNFDVTVKGHFQLLGLAFIALRLILNKDVKTMIRLFKGEGMKRGRE